MLLEGLLELAELRDPLTGQRSQALAYQNVFERPSLRWAGFRSTLGIAKGQPSSLRCNQVGPSARLVTPWRRVKSAVGFPGGSLYARPQSVQFGIRLAISFVPAA